MHILRHTFCSHLAMKGALSRAIQELAGHADLSTAPRYVHLSPAATGDAISLLDGRQSGAELARAWWSESPARAAFYSADGGHRSSERMEWSELAKRERNEVSQAGCRGPRRFKGR